MTQEEIPGLVRAQLKVHTADTLLALERVRAELDRTTTSTARSRVLRGLREQLMAQLEAWEYLAVMAESGYYQAYREVNGSQLDGPLCVDPKCPAGRAHTGPCPGTHRKDSE